MPRIDPDSVPTQTFEWGAIKWFVSPDATDGAGLTFGEVVLLPGQGHERHNHPDSEEIIYILSGKGEQMLDDGEPFEVGLARPSTCRPPCSTRPGTPAGNPCACLPSTTRVAPKSP